jgi:UDP-glucuronate 4-epimerase
MRVLVTGAAGFHWESCRGVSTSTRAMTSKRWITSMIINDPAQKRANAQILATYPRFALHEVDLRDEPGVGRVVSEGHFDAIVHLAAMAGVRYSIERAPLYTDVNIRGTVNVLEAARHAGVPHIVFASTSSVYGKTQHLPFQEDDPLGEPLAPYPASKIAGELFGYTYHNMFALTFTAVRFFSVYGPRGRPDMMPYIITDSIVHDKTFRLYDAGEMWRIGPTSAICQGSLRPWTIPGLSAHQFGRGEPVRMADFVALVEQLVGRKRRWRHLRPLPVSRLLLTPISPSANTPWLCPSVSVAEGMAHFWEWYRSRCKDNAWMP